MKQSDLSHLRRLLGWVRCDIGQDPAGQQQTMIDIADKLGIKAIDADAKARLVHSYRRAEAVPVYVRDAVKALEKTVAAAGRGPGAETPRATAETRANTGFDPGAAAGRAPALDDVQVERGLAEIGVHVWGPRAEDWLAGAEYAARILRGSEASPAAAPLQSHPGAVAEGVVCRDTPAEAPPFAGTISAARARPDQEIIQSLRGLRLGVEMDRHNLDDGDAKLGALDATINALSKLRAPVADERGLLPCPFCGSEAFETFKTDDDGIRRHSVHCKAPNCGGQTRDRHFSEAEAIAAWNCRATLASAPLADGWQPIDTAPSGVRVLLGPRETPVVGIVKRYEDPDIIDDALVCNVVHYNGTLLVAGYRCSEWAPLASAPVDDAGNWQQYRLDADETAEQIIERERAAYANLLQSVMNERRARASAPVAGEAHQLAEALRDWHGKGDGITTTIPDELAQALYGFLHAAPQASDAVRDAAQFVLKTFKTSEEQGYHTRDRQFAISILKEALSAPQADKDGGYLSSGNGPETRAGIGFVGGHLDADTVVLLAAGHPYWQGFKPSGSEESIDLYTADQLRAAVLADRQQRAGKGGDDA